jgi:hypothetical protein
VPNNLTIEWKDGIECLLVNKLGMKCKSEHQVSYFMDETIVNDWTTQLLVQFMQCLYFIHINWNKSQLQKLKQINYHLLNKQTMMKDLRNEHGESLASARISSKVENFFSFFFFWSWLRQSKQPIKV